MTKTLRRRAGLPARVLEAGLWLSAACCATTVAVWAMQAESSQRLAAHIKPGQASEAQWAKPGDVLGELHIAELHFSAPVIESYDPATLSRGVGHIPGTAVPGGLGNLVLAGHRDTFFRPLRKAQPGMVIDVTSKSGRWSYSIDRTEVVTPDRVDIMDVGDRPEMTLVTCYPFDFVGAAPQRFIVHAHLLSVDSSR